MSSLSRRGFLHTSLGAAAAVTAAAALDASAQDAAEKKSTPKGSAKPESTKDKSQAPGDPSATPKPAEPEQPKLTSFPKEKIRVAVMGCGGRGGSHVDAFAGTKGDSVVVALCDPDRKRMEGFVKKVQDRQPNMPEPRAEQDIRKLLDDKDIDAVSIATCNHWHALGAIWAIEAGKDVYVEKPCSHNVSEGRRIVEYARRNNRIVQHGTQSRSDGAIRAAVQFVHDGGIGKLQLARALCYKRRPTIGHAAAPQAVPPEIDYNLWLGPAPERPLEREKLHYDWHYVWDYGNGDLGNQGVHQMDIAAWGINAKELPRAVQSAGGRLGYVDDGQTPNTLMALYDYGDAGKLLFEVRGLETDKVLGVGVGNIFYGTEGYVVIGAEGGPAAYTPDGEKVRGFKEPGEDHFENFLKAVRSRKTDDLSADIEKGHVTAALCHLGNISYRVGSPRPLGGEGDLMLLGGNDAVSQTWHRTKKHLANNGVNLADAQYVLGRKLAVDPRGEHFTGDGAAEANQLLSRTYRKPFVVPDRIA